MSILSICPSHWRIHFYTLPTSPFMTLTHPFIILTILLIPNKCLKLSFCSVLRSFFFLLIPICHSHKLNKQSATYVALCSLKLLTLIICKQPDLTCKNLSTYHLCLIHPTQIPDFTNWSFLPLHTPPLASYMHSLSDQFFLYTLIKHPISM